MLETALQLLGKPGITLRYEMYISTYFSFVPGDATLCSVLLVIAILRYATYL